MSAAALADRVLAALAGMPAGERLLAALEGTGGVHLVGGAVRDLALGRTPHELDLLAEDDGPALAAALAERLGGELRVHGAFGTATVAAPGTPVDVATARAEDYPRPGALPVVRHAVAVEEDLRRRDFTLNALAVGLSPDRRGALTAAPGAVEDLQALRLRVLHDRSFEDDATRLIRLTRYGPRLGAVLHPRTEQLARAAFAAGAPATVGASRWARELWLLLGEPRAVAGLELLSDLADGAVPGPPGGLTVDPPRLERVLALLPEDGSREHALLAALTCGVQAAALRGWLERAHVPRPELVLAAAPEAAALAGAMASAGDDVQLARLLRPRPVEAVAVAGALGADEPARRYLTRLRGVRLAITGADLLAAGVPQGPEIGRRLAAALDAKVAGRAPTRRDELRAALKADLA